jgi:hypothetical protein
MSDGALLATESRKSNPVAVCHDVLPRGHLHTCVYDQVHSVGWLRLMVHTYSSQQAHMECVHFLALQQVPHLQLVQLARFATRYSLVCLSPCEVSACFNCKASSALAALAALAALGPH